MRRAPGGPPPPDAGTEQEPYDAGGDLDAGLEDSGDTTDSGRPRAPDAGRSDAGPGDGGIADGDAGTTDAGQGGNPDAGVPDAGLTDAGTLDAGALDGGAQDARPPALECGNGVLEDGEACEPIETTTRA